MDPASWNKLKDLIFDALQQAPSDREAYLRERCADPALRESAMAMLRSYVDNADALGSLQSEAPSSSDGFEDADELDDLQPGTRVGSYVIIDRVGDGGMGRVFVARDQELRRKVALKCLLSGGANPASERARIVHEARAAAAISHANVATVHHVLEHGTRAFMVMEFVEGETLAARLKRERLPFDRVLTIGRQLSAALAAAHARNVIHRDLKPANVQMTTDGSVKVLDFGIAQAFHTASSASSHAATTSGLSVPPGLRDAGTPTYMAPEQLLGHGVDERSDIFSLGVVMFEMATGRRPFAGSSKFEIVQAQARGAARVDAVDPAVPHLLADVIEKAIALDAQDRYQSAAEMGRALDAVSAAVAPRTAAADEPIRKWTTRVLTSAMVVLFGLLFVGGTRIWGFNNTFGRTGSFARFGAEPLWTYPRWAIPGTVGKLVVGTLLMLMVLVVRGLARAVGALAPEAAARARAAVSRIIPAGDAAAGVLAYGLAAIAIVVLVGVWWDHRPLINAWMVSFNSAPLEMFDPIRESRFERFTYHIHLTVAIFGLGYGFYKVLELQRQRGTSDGALALITLGGVIAVLVVMNEAPYKALNDRDFERVEYAGERCYITGESGGEFLVLCPNVDPPRNRVVRGDDPQLKRPGAIENLFRGVNAARLHH